MFLEATNYRSLLSGIIVLGKISFTPKTSIQIATSGSGGGAGFGPLISSKIIIKNGEDTKRIKEFEGSKRGTPLTDFITNNLGVLFEEVSA